MPSEHTLTTHHDPSPASGRRVGKDLAQTLEHYLDQGQRKYEHLGMSDTRYFQIVLTRMRHSTDQDLKNNLENIVTFRGTEFMPTYNAFLVGFDREWCANGDCRSSGSRKSIGRRTRES